MTLTYRDALLNLAPRWLKGFYGSRILFAIGTTIDALGDSLVEGMSRKFPAPVNPLLNHCAENIYDPYTLLILGQQRGISRGLSETDASYARRLQAWRFSRKRKGNFYALAEQLQAYLQPYPVQIRLQYDNGTRHTLSANGYSYAEGGYQSAPSGTVAFDTHAFNFDNTSAPYRYWLMMYGHPWSTDGYWQDDGYWADYNTSDSALSGTVLDPLSTDPTPTYGSTASLSTVSGIRALVNGWTPPHSECAGIIVCFDQDTFDNISPDGTWNRPGNQSASYVYWKSYAY